MYNGSIHTDPHEMVKEGTARIERPTWNNPCTLLDIPKQTEDGSSIVPYQAEKKHFCQGKCLSINTFWPLTTLGILD